MKNAIVTGSGSGLGKEIALALADAGADVVVTDLPDRMPAARETSQLICNMGRNGHAVPLDVTSLKSIEKMVTKSLRLFGRIDVLVNNAGINISRPALEVTEEQWDKILNVNLKGVFFCAQAVGRHMVKQKSGKIINMASQNGVIGYYNRVAYCARKAGVVNLTRVLAIEWAPFQVNVNAIASGTAGSDDDIRPDQVAATENVAQQSRRGQFHRQSRHAAGEYGEVQVAVMDRCCWIQTRSSWS